MPAKADLTETDLKAADDAGQSYLEISCRIKQNGTYIKGADGFATVYVPFGGFTLEAGKCYTFTLVVGKNGPNDPVFVPIDYSVDVTDWDEDELKVEPEAVDLGLPSGTKWANINIGAKHTYEAGDFFCWGETTPREGAKCGELFSADYKLTNNDSPDQELLKYFHSSVETGSGDNLETLLPEDDAASVNWGGKWRMPTYSEVDELGKYCTVTNIEVNKNFCFKIIGPNGKYIVIPCTRSNEGMFWTSTLATQDDYSAVYLDLFGTPFLYTYEDRATSLPIRPVQSR